MIMTKEEILNLLNKLTYKQKELIKNIDNLLYDFHNLMRFRKSVYPNLKKYYEEDKKYINKLKLTYKKIKDYSLKDYEKVLQSFSFKEEKLKKLNEVINFIKKLNNE